MITELNMKNYNENVVDKDTLTLVDVWAPWCGPCRMLGPIVDKIAKENEQYNICKLNADDNRELAISLGVKNIPAVFIIKKGKILDKFVGVKSEQEILAILEKNNN